MQVLMSFLVMPPAETVEAVWPTLDQARRDEIATTLARLIAKAIERNAADDGEERDE